MSEAQLDPNRKTKTEADLRLYAEARNCLTCSSMVILEGEAKIDPFILAAMNDPSITTKGDVLFWSKIAIHKSHLN